MTDPTFSVRHLFPQVFANGYVPIPNVDKKCMLPAWTTVLVDERQARRWARQRKWPAIGIRVEPPLIVIDIDVLDAALADAIDRMVPPGALSRIGQAPKVARFLRYEGKPFKHMATRSWTRDRKLPKAKWSKVEVFAGVERGKATRQFGAFGPHSHDKATGAVLATYAWPDGRDPSNTPIGDLPVIGYEQALGIVNAAEDLLERSGMTVDAGTHSGPRDKVKVFDLLPETLFEATDGNVYDLAGLELAVRVAMVKGGELRVSGSFTKDPLSKGAPRRGLAGISPDHHCVYVYDTKTGITHHPAAVEAERIARDEAFLNLISGVLPYAD